MPLNLTKIRLSLLKFNNMSPLLLQYHHISLGFTQFTFCDNILRNTIPVYCLDLNDANLSKIEVLHM